MIKLKIGDASCTIFSSWKELTIQQAQGIAPNTAAPFFQRLAAHTGLSEEYLKDADLSDDDVEMLLDLISWDQIDVSELLDDAPKTIHFHNADHITEWTIRIPQTDAAFKDRRIRVPGNAAIQPVGSKIMFDQYVNSGKSLIETAHYAIAVYLQPVYFDGVFDGDQVEQLAQIALRCNFIEGLSVAAFFLSRHQSLHGMKSKNSNIFPQQKKRKLELIGLEGLDSLGTHTN